MAGGVVRIYDLGPARPDAWFEAVLKQSPDFERAAEIIGRATLGLGLIAGARILSITPNAHSPKLTTVEFSIADDTVVRRASLHEFRESVASRLLSPLEATGLSEDADAEALQRHIGGRYMLEASLFQVKPLELRYDLGLSEIKLEFNGAEHVLTLEDFRDVIDERVRAELGLGPGSDEMAIDLALVDEAEKANARKDWGTTVAMLTPWLAPISMLLRTREAEALAEQAHERLSDALDLLGTAYARMGDLDAANEVLRLGVQWAGESRKAADLFLALGCASVEAKNYGEAIGLLRRAMRLGADKGVALPLLARSLAARDQGLAAMVCFERARELGSMDERAAEVESELRAGFGEAWGKLEALKGDAE